MAVNECKLQKTLVRKKAKRKAAKAVKLAHIRGPKATFGARDVTVASRSPVHECLVPHSLFELGIGNVVVAKRMPTRKIGVGIFLLDVYCLGVKDAFYAIMDSEEYTWRLQRIDVQGDFETIRPSCARKLIEGAIRYANQFGFKPHEDYKGAKKIFGDIDHTDCSRRFDYGCDGKPFYVSGPHDTPQKSRAILKTLSKQCGPDGFYYMIGIRHL